MQGEGNLLLEERKCSKMYKLTFRIRWLERLGGRAKRGGGEMFWRDGSNVYKVERGENWFLFILCTEFLLYGWFACDLRIKWNFEIFEIGFNFYFYETFRCNYFASCFASRLGHYSSKIVQIVWLKLLIYLIRVKKKYYIIKKNKNGLL